LAIEAHQAFLEQISDCIAGVVIGDGETVQALGAPGGNEIFRARDAVSRKERMRMQVDIKWHVSRALKE
jgi:hypothetical protein